MRIIKTLLAGSVLAVGHPAQAGMAPSDDGETIIVTAAGRSQSAQDVPIAVSVISGDMIANAGISDIRGLRQISPSFQSTTGQSSVGAVVLRIRGVGTAGDNPGFEPSVGVFIDGVFRARAGVALADLPPVDRIEVLRGPQGTLFGRNTSAGALSITTQAPSFDLGGYAEASYGNYHEVELRGGLTGPVSQVIAMRIDGGYHKRDGYIMDVNGGPSIDDLNRAFVRGQALVQTGDIKLRVIGDYAQTRENCCGALNTNSGFVLYPGLDPSTSSAIARIASGVVSSFAGNSALGGTAGTIGLVAPFVPGDRRMAVTPGRGYGEAVNEWGLSGQLDWDLGDGLNLTSVTAFRNWRARRNQDVDFSGLDRAYRDGYRNGVRDFTQELRLQGRAFGDHLDWLVGGYYLNEKLTLKDTVRFGAQADQYTDGVFNGLTRSTAIPTGLQLYGTLGPGVPLFAGVALPRNPAGSGQTADNYAVDTQAFALFTHNIIKLGDPVSLTLGARFNHERKSIDATLNSVVPACSFLNSAAAAGYRSALISRGLGGIILLACNPILNPEFNGSYADARSEDQLTGTAKLSYKFDDHVMLYGGYDRGYKSGGYNLDRATFDTVVLGGNGAQIGDLHFGKETVDAYELGLKTTFSRALTVNLAAFSEDFHNFQDLTFIGLSFVVTPVKKVRARGIEAEAIIEPVRNLTVNLGYAYNDTRYRDDALPIGLAESNTIQVTNQPKHVVTAALTWTPEITPTIGALAHIDMRYNSDSNTNNTALARQFTTNDGYAVVNARIGLNFLDRKLGVEAYVENLFDTYYSLTSFPIPEQGNSYAVYPAPPRFYGVKARVSF